MDMSEMDAADSPVSWLPNLALVSMADLRTLDPSALAPALSALLSRIDRPLATVAGSGGS